MSKERELLIRALDAWDFVDEPQFADINFIFAEINAFLASEPEADDILNRAITALESTTLEITNITAFRNGAIDECIEAVGLGICRDGRDTSHYQQSQRHLEALRKLKTNPSPSRKPMTEKEIMQAIDALGFVGRLRYFVEGVRSAEKHHGIGGQE